ncbi:MAG: hypothetical protein ACJAVN_000664 [Roseivirga sp.]|jgi:hypothetical protein
MLNSSVTKNLILLLFALLTISCSKSINQDDLNGKWHVLIDDGEYYEHWVNDSLSIWLNSYGQIQTWITSLSGNELIYEQRYDRSFNELSSANFIEKVKLKDHDNLKITVKPNSNITYRWIRINDEVFQKDFRLIDFDQVLKEFKERQYQYFKLPNR